MSKYLLLITGEGEAPSGIPELLPWAKRTCKVAIKDRELTHEEIERTLRVMIRAITSKSTHRGDVFNFKTGGSNEQP